VGVRYRMRHRDGKVRRAFVHHPVEPNEEALIVRPG
jgi:hypothetical protein